MGNWLWRARSFALGVLAIGSLVACNAHHGGDHGTSETHFLRPCTASCEDGYSCLCGVCTLACEGDAVCTAQGNEAATCGAPEADRNGCGSVTKLCDMRCAADGDCRALGAEFGCESGRCRTRASMADAGVPAGSGAGSGGRSGGAGAGRSGAGGSSTSPMMDAGEPDAAAVRDAGTTADAGNPICDLPAVQGSCDALFRRYFHDTASGYCVPFTYGGCEGNANNFETLEACEAACGRSPGPPGTACEVNGTIYPSGTDGIGDPQSCNKCLCSDGQLICTEINCPMPCRAGTKYGVSCSQCGPADACETLRTGCLPTCETSDDCTGDAPPFCFDGVCRILCG